MASEVEEDGPDINFSWCVQDDLEKIMKMIENLNAIVGESPTTEKAYEDFWKMLSKFQDQPQLLDGHLEKILNELVDVVMNTKSCEGRLQAFKYLHTVMKVRGYKRVVRYMSHEVSYLEPVMTMLESADLESDCWQASYVLLVWLSILILTPFPLSYFDPPTAVGVQVPTMMLRIEFVIKKHLMSSDKFNVSSNLAANFYTRVDVKEKMLSPFLDWINSVITNEKEQTIFKVAVMAGAAAILKRGEREDLIEHAQKLLIWLLEGMSSTDRASLLYRKYRIKLVQRIGLTFVKKWKVKWRYGKSHGSLLQNLAKTVDPALSGDSNVASLIDLTSLSCQEQLLDEEQFEEDVLEYLSEVIDNLIESLEDSDTVVRWSAAKGIGRLTERLTQQMSDMVLTSVLDIFSERKHHNSWHGACLALAQMASRCLLPQSRLTEIVKHVISALMYDEPRRFSSVGENVRDAACYVFWAFARAFNEEDLKPLSNLIMTNLLLVALFDREVHCRRAASAAFQEYVGRCSSVSDGIAIMNEADYMSVGIRHIAFLHVSVQVAQIGGFTKAMIEHLIVNRLCHWDAVIRDLAAKALHLLSPFEPLFVSSFLPTLVKTAYSEVLTERLGAAPAIGEIIHGLYVAGSLHNYVDNETLKSIKSILPNYRRNGLLRGIGGDMIKGSCCRYIWKCSESKIEVDDIAEDWVFVIQECVYNVDEEIREAAVVALQSFLGIYSSPTLSDKIVKEYVAVLSAMSEDADLRRACGASALCHIPNVIFEKHLDAVIPALIKCIHVSEKTMFFTESRSMAIKALVYVVTNTEISNISNDTICEIFWCFINSLEDYTRNRKGDVGSNVRYEAVVALFALTRHVLTHKITILEQNMVEIMVPKLMQLALEPQDKVSICAGEVLGKLLYSEPEVPYIPELDKLKKIFPHDLCTDVEWWKEDVVTYHKFIEVLRLMDPHYTHHIVMGFVMTIGGVSEGTVLNVGSIFFEALEEIPLEKVCDIAIAVVKVFTISLRVEHLLTPVLIFLNRLLDNGALNNVLYDQATNFAADILSTIKKGARKFRDFNKIKVVISILCALSTVEGQVGLQAFHMLIRYLKHNSMAVRTTAATLMFETLSLLGDDIFPGYNMKVVMKLLAETSWKGCADEYTEAVSKISEEMAVGMKI